MIVNNNKNFNQMKKLVIVVYRMKIQNLNLHYKLKKSIRVIKKIKIKKNLLYIQKRLLIPLLIKINKIQIKV